MALTITANEAVRRAAQTLGVIQPGETLDANLSEQGRVLLAEMVDAWNIQALTVLATERTVYDLVSDQGGPDDPYTIGPGGDFDTGTAARPVAIRAANLLLNTSSPYAVEIPLAILTDQMDQANAVKSLTSSQPTTLYYEPRVPLGYIQLWPIPDNATNDLVLYTDILTAAFAGPDVAYVCPPGYAKAFRLCLASALCDQFGIDGSRIDVEAREALTELKMANVVMADLSVGPEYTQNSHGSYVIQTDEGG